MLRLLLRKIMFSTVVVAGSLVGGLVAAYSCPYFASLGDAERVVRGAAWSLTRPRRLAS